MLRLGLIVIALIFWPDLSALWPLFVRLLGLALLGAGSLIGHGGIPFLCANGKRKKHDEPLFTGPVVVGSHAGPRRHDQ